MGANNSSDASDEYVSRLIRTKAREVAGKYGFSWADIKDLEQEFWLDLLQRLSSYNPLRSQMDTFVTRLVMHKIANIKESQGAAKRDYRLCRTLLDEDVEDGEGGHTSRSTLFDEAECFRRLGWSYGPSEEQRDLKIDLAAVHRHAHPEEQCLPKDRADL
jgi:DNA-directed RNA polymerase specialized sigma24 family protein